MPHLPFVEGDICKPQVLMLVVFESFQAEQEALTRNIKELFPQFPNRNLNRTKWDIMPSISSH